MRIGLFHGWELRGSGSNEYTRYLAWALGSLGHDVHVFCREPEPLKIKEAKHIVFWNSSGREREEKGNPSGSFFLHVLPHHEKIRPVYVEDKQRKGPVKAFTRLTDEELEEYINFSANILSKVFEDYDLDIIHANHIVPQPYILSIACRNKNIPYIVYPHGSAIEYTVKEDDRYKKLALEGIKNARKLIIGSNEVKDRLIKLFPSEREKINKSDIIGVGVDTNIFKPIEREKRKESVDKIIEKGPYSGRDARVDEKLKRIVAQGNLDEIIDISTDYDRTKPDKDIGKKLESIKWDSSRILIFVGALTGGKGLQSLVFSMPYILRENRDTYLLIVGSGAYREVLEALVFAISRKQEKIVKKIVEKGFSWEKTHKKGPWEDAMVALKKGNLFNEFLEECEMLEKRIFFLGRMGHDILKHLFPCADIAVFPSVVPEAYPLVLMESLSAGVLPAATYFSGFKEGLDELKGLVPNSLLDSMSLPVDPETRIKKMGEKINSLFKYLENNPPITQTLRKIAEQKYDWRVRAKEMAEAYKIGFNKK